MIVAVCGHHTKQEKPS